jgi:hypothetical protein
MIKARKGEQFMKFTLIFMILSMETGLPQYTANIERYETLEQCNAVKEALFSMEKEELSKRSAEVKHMAVRCVEEPSKP